METLKIPNKHKNILRNFTQGLKNVYQEGLVSIILYGSAVSGEFVDKHSNLNLLVVLKSTDLENLKKSSKLIRKFNMVNVLFFTENYIARSVDIFPIEFLDMQENHFVIYGKDILKDIHIDIRNLRFQCEQELKEKLLKLQHGYLRTHDNTFVLRRLLFTTFTSILHIARNVLRLKGARPPYLKQEILKELASQFKINIGIWEKILVAKNKQIKLSRKETEEVFTNFTKELESILNIIEQL